MALRSRQSITKQLEELAAEIAALRATTSAKAGIPVIVVAPCGCEGCAGALRKDSYDGSGLAGSGSSGSGDAVVITLGCAMAIPPPMEVPLDPLDDALPAVTPTAMAQAAGLVRALSR